MDGGLGGPTGFSESCRASGRRPSPTLARPLVGLHHPFCLRVALAVCSSATLRRVGFVAAIRYGCGVFVWAFGSQLTYGMATEPPRSMSVSGSQARVLPPLRARGLDFAAWLPTLAYCPPWLTLQPLRRRTSSVGVGVPSGVCSASARDVGPSGSRGDRGLA